MGTFRVLRYNLFIALGLETRLNNGSRDCMGTRPKLPWASLHEVVASKQPIMEPGSPEMKRFRDLPNRSLNGALKDETRQVVELSEVGKLGRKNIIWIH